jgi:hypothetical protein
VAARGVAAAGVTAAAGLWKRAVGRGGAAVVSAPAAGCCNSGDAWRAVGRDAWRVLWGWLRKRTARRGGELAWTEGVGEL